MKTSLSSPAVHSPPDYAPVSHSFVYGGFVTSADNEALGHFSHALYLQCDVLDSVARQAYNASDMLYTRMLSVKYCPYHQSSTALNDAAYLQIHRLERNYKSLLAISEKLRCFADKIQRAIDIYAQAEQHTHDAMDALISTVTAIFPGYSFLGMVSFGIIEQAISGKFSAQAVIASSHAWHEGMMRGIGHHFMWPQDAYRQLTGELPKTHDDVIAQSSDMLTPLTDSVSHVWQGRTVSVQQTYAPTPLPPSSSMSDALGNLSNLTTFKQHNDYGTVAIQRFSQADGSHSWVVIIPGTDGHHDSPFGWLQNVDLMSSKPDKRRSAYSFQAVREAMRQAHIPYDEHVTLVGHSQGGIVAASMASDPQCPYRISHVVTAGSPIGLHSIDTSHTWVTSIETDRELVSSLDGVRNPEHPHRLTIHGQIRTHPDHGNDTAYLDPLHSFPFAQKGTPINDVHEDSELTHGMNYHLSAFRDAHDLHRADLAEHEKHFATLSDGQLDTTMYFTCRMSPP